MGERGLELDIGSELLKLQKKMKRTELEIAQVKGEITQLESTLEQEVGGCDDVDSLLLTMKKKFNRQTKRIERGIKKLREDYDWE